MSLITYQKVFDFTHNDLHTNNIMYQKTDKEFLYYRFNESYYNSDEFFGNLIEARKNISAYLTELKQLKTKYSDLKSLCIDEVNK